jgi:hypothetical protein
MGSRKSGDAEERDTRRKAFPTVKARVIATEAAPRVALMTYTPELQRSEMRLCSRDRYANASDVHQIIAAALRQLQGDAGSSADMIAAVFPSPAGMTT